MFASQINPVDELKSLFPGSDDPVATAVKWANANLKEQGIDPKSNPMGAMKEIRDQESALSLRTPVYLLEKVVDSRK